MPLPSQFGRRFDGGDEGMFLWPSLAVVRTESRRRMADGILLGLLWAVCTCPINFIAN